MLTQFTRRLLATTLSVAVFLEPAAALAATRTWDAGGSDNNWSTAANWSDNTVPTASDIALFDGTGKKDATIDAAFGGSVAELRIAAANTGTVTVGRALTINKNFSLSGGTFRINGGNAVTVKGSWQNGGGTFTSNTGTVLLTGSGTSYALKETGAFKHLSLDDGLVGHWRFDESTGTGAIDSGRFQSHGMYKGGASRSTSLPTLGFLNTTSANFDGVNDYIEVTTLGTFGQILDTGPVAVSAWFKMSSIGVDGAVILGSLNTGTNTGLYLYVYPNGTIEWFIRGQGEFHTHIGVTPTSSVADGTWHHIVAVKNGPTTSSMAVYIDGVLQTVTDSRDDGPGQTTINLAFPLFIGMANSRGTPLWGLNGQMDDVRIYNRSLSYSEIQALYSGNQGTGSGRYTLGSNLTVNGNLNIYSGNLDTSISNYSITASGSFVNNATFTPRSGTVTLSGIGTHLKTYGTSLYNLAIAASKSAILRTAATVTNALTVNTSSTLTLNGNDLTATNAAIANSGTLTEGTGAIIHPTSLSVSPSSLAIGNSVTVTLADGDENTDGTTRETVTVILDDAAFTLTETTATSGVFQGTVATAHAAPTGDNTTIESNTRCGFFISVRSLDNQDATDSVSAQAEVTDSAVPCEISSGGGGGSRTIQRTTSPSTSSTRPSAPTAPGTTSKNAELCSDITSSSTTKSRGEQQIAALCRRRDIVIRKALSAETLNEQKRFDSLGDFILGVIGRLKARM